MPTAHEALLAHLCYLADRLLIQLKYIDDFSFKILAIKLTRTGQDVVNDLIEVEEIERISATDPPSNTLVASKVQEYPMSTGDGASPKQIPAIMTQYQGIASMTDMTCVRISLLLPYFYEEGCS